MTKLKRVNNSPVFVDRGRYEEAIKDGREALDELKEGRATLGGGLLSLGLAIGRAWMAAHTPACESCGERPAVLRGLCRPCHSRPRVK